MSLFFGNNNTLIKLKTLPLGKEKKLQRMIENNLREVLNMDFIASEFPTSKGGRIDTLAVDDNGAPVILEYKRHYEDNIINQGLSYLKWLREQPQEFFEILLRNQLGNEAANNIKVDWAHSRVVCIAKRFSKFDLDTVDIIPIRIDLFTYNYYEHDLLDLEMVKVCKQQSRQTNPCQVLPLETTQGIVTALMDQKGVSLTIRELFAELRNRIMGLDKSIMEKPGNRAIAYRIDKNFAEIMIRKDKLVIDLRPINFIDPRFMVEKIYDGYVVTMNRRIKLTRKNDLEYVFGIVEQSFQNIL